MRVWGFLFFPSYSLCLRGDNSAGRKRQMHECVHTQSISQSMHASGKRKVNSRTFEDSAWETLQNVVCFSPLQPWTDTTKTWTVCNWLHRYNEYSSLNVAISCWFLTIKWVISRVVHYKNLNRWMWALASACTLIMALHCRWGSYPWEPAELLFLGTRENFIVLYFFRFGVLYFF